MNDGERDFLLRTYGEEYGPEAGPWNTSVQSKYLEYRLACFFEEHFAVRDGDTICNVGIGAGSWDRYLSYKLRGGRLISIDMDEICCRQLELRLINEKNPSRVQVLFSDLLLVDGLTDRVDIVTMVGSTRRESGLYEPILRKAISLVKPGGGFYYQTLDPTEEKDAFLALCQAAGCRPESYLLDTAHGMKAQYFKVVK